MRETESKLKWIVNNLTLLFKVSFVYRQMFYELALLARRHQFLH